jgi:hypothetical protein
MQLFDRSRDRDRDRDWTGFKFEVEIDGKDGHGFRGTDATLPIIEHSISFVNLLFN